MPRRAAKVDSNQPAIVKAFQAAGARVQHLHAVGGGCPDLLVSFRGVDRLVEVIGPDKKKRFPPDGLSPSQVEWHRNWLSPIAVIENETQALNLLGLVPLRGTVS